MSAEAGGQPAFERVEGLRWKLNFPITSADLDGHIEQWLRQVGPSVKMKGFRPGKVPMRVLRERYGKQALGETLPKIAKSRFHEYVTKDGRTLAHDPNIQITRDEGNYTVECEFDEMPQFDPPDIAGVELRRPVLEIAKEDLDEAIVQLRLAAAKRKERDGPAREGDTVEIACRLLCADEPFLDTKDRAIAVRLERKNVADALVGALTGKGAGDKGTASTQFPDGHFTQRWSGKEAKFEFEVRRVFEHVEPELDEEFVKSLGIEGGTQEALRSALRENLVAQSHNLTDQVYRMRALHALVSRAPEFPLPRSLIEAEKGIQLRARVESLKRGGLLDREFFETREEDMAETARRKVRMGLVVRTVAGAIGASATDEAVQAHFRTAAPDTAAENSERFRRDPQYAALVRGALTEAAVLGRVFAEAKVEDEKMSATQLRKEYEENV